MSAFRMRMKTPEDWARIRADGRRAFVLRFGLGVFALFGIAFTTLWIVAVDPLVFGAASPAAGEIARHIVVALVVWPLGGWLFARWIWRRNEKRFGSQLEGTTATP
jgi:hypothetical protein